jgi:hypothetical protein
MSAYDPKRTLAQLHFDPWFKQKDRLDEAAYLSCDQVF